MTSNGESLWSIDDSEESEYEESQCGSYNSSEEESEKEFEEGTERSEEEFN